MPAISADEISRRLGEDTPFYARNVLKIADKSGKIVPFDMSAGQLVLDAKLTAQREAGKPQRAIALKARQIGVSTYVQAKKIQALTQRPNITGLTVAHDLATGEKLYRIGQRMYQMLPDDPSIKPGLGSHQRGRRLHFGDKRADGTLYPDSYYLVDTAGEGESGRGGTYFILHLSELGFWPGIEQKLTALGDAVPDDPESLIVAESTANGANEFKDLWDDAVAGRSDYVPFFWPWWKEPAYTLPFSSEAEKERFRVGDTSQSPYAEGERELVEPGPLDFETNQNVPLTLEQLHWRRYRIANVSRSILKFNQEMPATPQEAFIASGRQVFDPTHIKQVWIGTSLTDPREPSEEFPGPNKGIFKAKATQARRGRSGMVDVPTDPLWVPDSKLTLGQVAEWSLWDGSKPRTQGQFVVSTDVASGEVDGPRGETAYHGIEVIDQRERVQVGEYRSRIDPDLLAEQVYLAALFFNRAWIVVEVTGGWGLPVARRIWLDYRYPYLYFQRKPDQKNEKKESRLGWDTNRKTLPIIQANMAEMLREGTHGIRSRLLAEQLGHYVMDERGRAGPEPGKYSDNLLAYMFGQFVAGELPIRRDSTNYSYAPRDKITGY